MSVDLELFLHFDIREYTPNNVVQVLCYLFSTDKIEYTIEEDEVAFWNICREKNKLKPCSKSEEFIDSVFYPLDIEEPYVKFFKHNPCECSYDWRAVGGWVMKDKNRKKSFDGTSVFFLGKIRNYGQQLETFLKWVQPYIDTYDEDQTMCCIGWLKNPNKVMPRLMAIETITNKELKFLEY